MKNKEEVLKAMIKYYLRDTHLRDLLDTDFIKRRVGEIAKVMGIDRIELLKVTKEVIVEMLDGAREKVLNISYK